MIGWLRGKVRSCEPGRLTLDVGGVGYELQIPLSTYYRIAERDAGQVDLMVHTHVREDAITLFGFATREERSMFLHLTSISGVGPRLALATLSGIGPEELAQAVREQDHTRIRQVPGIGKKTAARIVLELKDRLAGDGRAGTPAAGPGSQRPVRLDAVSALTNLGYSEDAAFKAVDRVMKDLEDGPADLQVVLRAALQNLTR